MLISKIKNQADVLETKTFLTDVVSTLSYRKFYESIINNANALLTMVEANRNKPIVVFIDRNVESVVCFFSIAATGNFYVPVDVLQPVQRISLIVDTLDPALIINATNRKSPELDREIINYDDLIERYHYDEKCILDIGDAIIDTDPLYAMFTSGSTGTPKGVLVSYRSVLNLINQFDKEFKFNEDDVFGNQAPFDFDVSVKDIYNALHVGASIVIIPKVNFSFPAKLVEFLNEHKITIGIWAVSVLRIVENLKGLDKNTPKFMRKILFSGEVMSNKVLNYWRQHLSNTTFVNLYGPTEITCNCSFYIVDKPYCDTDILPIGKAFSNTRIIILDEQNRIVNTPNTQGELCVIGSSLALGYYNNPVSTKDVFVSNPVNTTFEEKIYRTGDLGYYNEAGLLMFVSRKDHQIKHMGHRIELGEIENSANSLPMIDASFCIYDTDEEKIVMFYQSQTLSHRDLYRALLDSLPKYMVPNRFIHYDTLPLNNNNKIDRVNISREYYENKDT